jgi:hypothetical protein
MQSLHSQQQAQGQGCSAGTERSDWHLRDGSSHKHSKTPKSFSVSFIFNLRFYYYLFDFS